MRYEYPAFCETRFRVVVQQDGRTALNHVMGAKNSPRFGFGEPLAKAQHDPAWGPEGLFEEVVTVPELKAGKARIYLKGVAQPQTPGVAAHRNIDLVYLTRDSDDAWRRHYARHTKLYPLLDAFRDSRGPRYEVRFTNRGDKSADFHITHVYNRVPWGVSEAEPVRDVAPGSSSGWIAAAHAGYHALQSRALQRLGQGVRRGNPARRRRRWSANCPAQTRCSVYLPPYPGKGDKAITPMEELDAVLAELKKTPAIGKKPTQPLCFGGWMPARHGERLWPQVRPAVRGARLPLLASGAQRPGGA